MHSMSLEDSTSQAEKMRAAAAILNYTRHWGAMLIRCNVQASAMLWVLKPAMLLATKSKQTTAYQ